MSAERALVVGQWWSDSDCDASPRAFEVAAGAGWGDGRVTGCGVRARGEG